VRAQPPPAAGWNLQKLLLVAAFLIEFGAATLHHKGDVVAAFGFGAGPTGGEGVFLTPPLIFVALLLFYDRAWVYLVAGITVSLLPLFILIVVQFVFEGKFLFNDLSQGIDFSTLYMLLWAICLGLPAGIIGFNRRRKGRSMRSTLRSKQAITAMVISGFCLAMAFTGSFAAQAAAAGSQSGGFDFPVKSMVNVTTQDLAFVPKALNVPGGEMTQIVVTNKDATTHTFTYVNGGTEYSHDLLGGSTTKFLVKFDAPGTIKFRCKPHSSGYDDPNGMTGTIHVV
jgi:plastocyanin